MARKKKKNTKNSYIEIYNSKEYQEYIGVLCECYPEYKDIIKSITYSDMVNFTIPVKFEKKYPSIYANSHNLYQFLQLITGDDKQFLDDITVIGDALYNYQVAIEDNYGYGGYYSDGIVTYGGYYGKSYGKSHVKVKREKSELAKTKPDVMELL